MATPVFASAVVETAASADPTSSDKLRKAVKAKNIQDHLAALQDIADANGGNRAPGTEGHVQSAEYVEAQLADAGYETTRQEFSYDKTSIDEADFEQVAPTATAYELLEEFYPMDFTGEGDTTAPATVIDVNLVGDRANTSGCEAADFAGFTAGDIAVLQRGTCTFAAKAANAEAAGASGVVIFNQGNTPERSGVLLGTLGAFGVNIPVVGTSFAIGEALAGASGLELRVNVQTTTVTVDTFNVLASTEQGDPTKQVVVGGHLDSTNGGPGINDNGSGASAILELAIQLEKTQSVPTNQITFAFWGAEEDNLQGSNYFVSQLTDEEAANIALNLNVDMIGSPNAVNFVYDGDGSAFGLEGPEGSAEIEAVFEDYFDSQGTPYAPTAFDGRSDYFGFINAGIPAGGLFTGAEGVKTAEQAAIFGGTAGVAYDPCYHQACDTDANISAATLEVNADAMAHAVWVLAEAMRVPGTAADNEAVGAAWGTQDGWGAYGWGHTKSGDRWDGK